MSAADNLHPELFHATHVMFSPGDIVKATPHARMPEDVKAYATPDIETARGFAANANKVVERGTTRRGNDIDEEQGQMFGHIYQVEPLDANEELTHFESDSFKQVSSTKGFKVVRFVESVPSIGVSPRPGDAEREQRSKEFWEHFRRINTQGRQGSSD